MARLRLYQVELMLRRYAGTRESSLRLASMERGPVDGGSRGERADLDYLGTMAWALKRLPQRLTVWEFRRICGALVWPYVEPLVGRVCASLGVPDGGPYSARLSVAECWAFLAHAATVEENLLTSSRVILAMAGGHTDPVVLKRAAAKVEELVQVVADLKALEDAFYRSTDLEADLMALQKDPSAVDLWREGRR
jgi:hypothetical protein